MTGHEVVVMVSPGMIEETARSDKSKSRIKQAAKSGDEAKQAQGEVAQIEETKFNRSPQIGNNSDEDQVKARDSIVRSAEAIPSNSNASKLACDFNSERDKARVQFAPRASVANLKNEILQLAQKSSNVAAPSAKNLTKSLVCKSSNLLHSLKRHYSTLTANPNSGGSGSMNSSQSLSMSSPNRHHKSQQPSQDFLTNSTTANQARIENQRESSDQAKGRDGIFNRKPSSIASKQQKSLSDSATELPASSSSATSNQAMRQNSGSSTLGHKFNGSNQELLGTKISENSYLADTQSGANAAGPITSTSSNSIASRASPFPSARRHAIQTQSIQRTATLSLKAYEMKPKRASSIKSALKGAHLSPLRLSLDRRRANDKSNRLAGLASLTSGSGSGDSGPSEITSKPYELFEPPITQKTVQRSKRRGAMMSTDPRRQMSADTIGLRQLTDEYLANAGVLKPISSSGQCSLVALTGPTTSSQSPSAAMSPRDPAGAGSIGVYGTQPQYSIEAQLYQASRRVAGTRSNIAPSSELDNSSQQQTCSRLKQTNTRSSSEDSLAKDLLKTTSGNNATHSSIKTSHPIDANLSSQTQDDEQNICTCLPGNYPWQCDVSIQCGLLPAPPLVEPYETTGDILNAIARPYRTGPLVVQTDSVDNNHGGAANHLSATLKKGLTAISQHHLTPAAQEAALTVVGSLKKSLSNTLDIASLATVTSRNHQGHSYLHSQDSLPAYSSFQNEPDGSEYTLNKTDPNRNPNCLSIEDCIGGQTSAGGSGSGLIGHLASKLSRQSSKKMMVNAVGKKVGLQRALSFDYRGYKRFEQQPKSNSGGTQLAPPSCANNHSSLGFNRSPSGNREYHKSTANSVWQQADSHHLPRPYLPQSASQVDFQIPLLPHDRMQEAIMSQRLLNRPANKSSANNNEMATGMAATTGSGDMKTTSDKVDVDKLICVQPSDTLESSFATEIQPSIDELRDRCEHRPKQLVQSADDSQEIAYDNSIDTISQQATRKLSPPKLVFDTTQDSIHEDRCRDNNTTQKGSKNSSGFAESNTSISGRNGAGNQQSNTQLPQLSPHITVYVAASSSAMGVLSAEDAPRMMTSSPSFSIDPHGKSTTINSSVQLTAHDIFSGSNQFIKRPSTMLAGDGMSQMAQALSYTGSAGNSSSQSVTTRNRRQAIVPPKLATDPDSGDSPTGDEPSVGNLIDVNDKPELEQTVDLDSTSRRELRNTRLSGSGEGGSLRRKRSGGDPLVQKSYEAESINMVPTFQINDKQPESSSIKRPSSTQVQSPLFARPDSQATNPESLMSSGSATSLSRRDLASPSGLSVPFDLSRDRRRSSIAVIPQMQICPGDLLVYSKQLIDRMNQSNEIDTPDFLTIDDKKGKNIWSSFKLFDNRTVKARHELLCNLEDLLNSLPPATFKDDQLSHYKGMAWEEFLQETESRRSVSSEALAAITLDNEESNRFNDKNRHQNQTSESTEIIALSARGHNSQGSPGKSDQSPRSGSIKIGAWSIRGPRGSVKGSPIHQQAPNVAGGSANQASIGQSAPRAAPRKKPELRRGQTVDSVFRVPLVPSSPMKHAQIHQQTPTAHLEDLVTIEDDYERSDAKCQRQPGSNDSTAATDASQNQNQPRSSHRSSLSRSRAGQRCYRFSIAQQHEQNERDYNVEWHITTPTNSSFEMDALEAARELDQDDSRHYSQRSSSVAAHRQPTSGKAIGGSSANSNSNQNHSQHRHFMRQSSLSTLSSTITRTEQKRQRALWDLFQSECAFFFDHLLTLKNVYMEPLKKIQVEGFAMSADPDILFGNLDELCCGVYDFCKEFLHIIMRTLKTRPEELNATDVLIKLYKENPKIKHLRNIYHHYTLNYINALNFLYSLRRHVEFVEFEKWSSRDARCKKLQLTDLLVAPVQHIMRVPIILRDIESHTEDLADREEIKAILAVEDSSLRELDDKMRWLKNFERLLEIQKNILWPSVLDMDPKLFIPEFLKDVLSKQPCEKLIVSPRRQIVHEGTLCNFDQSKPCDMHVILFDDMLLLTRRKKGLTKKASTVCRTNPTSSSMKDDGTYKYIVYKQPLSLDRLYVHDILPTDAQAMGMKNVFMIVVLNRFQQIVTIHWFSAPNDDIKQTWQIKIKKTIERWKKSSQTDQSANNHQATTQADQLPTELLNLNDHRRYNMDRNNVNPMHQNRVSPSDGFPNASDQNQEARVNRDTVISNSVRDNTGTNGSYGQQAFMSHPVEFVVNDAPVSNLADGLDQSQETKKAIVPSVTDNTGTTNVI